MRRTGINSWLCLVISLAAHLSLILLWALPGSMFNAGRTRDGVRQEDGRLDFRLIEVPDAVLQQNPDRETNLVSDRNSRAADMNPDDLEDKKEPYTTGESALEQYEQADADYSPPEPRPSLEQDTELAAGVIPMRNIDYLEEMKSTRYDRNSRASAGFRNLSSSAQADGGISFNTYDWDFAPYMLAMKRRIESHLFPPYAFTHMGLVSGTNIIHFIVSPDGGVRHLEILDSNTHSSLDQTSLRAIELSLPFPPLPKGFPEDCLEVTARFSYIVRR